MRSSPKENQSLEVKVKGISEMEFSLSIFDYTFTNYVLPQTVSRTRYRVGLVLFLLPLLHGWLSPYLPLLLHGYKPTRLEALVGDLLLIVSLFLLGGDFWDKLRALFVWEARVTNTDN